MPATFNTLQAQHDTTVPHNNTIMNNYTYIPELYQRGTSTAGMRMFPNPARDNATIYINSIKDRDNGEVVIYNATGTPVYKNIIQNGNNNIDLGNLSNGIYIVKIFTRDRFSYTNRLVVQK
jgi:hypothetical protein